MTMRPGSPLEILQRRARSVPEEIRIHFGLVVSARAMQAVRTAHNVAAKSVLGMCVIVDSRVPDYRIEIVQLQEYEDGQYIHQAEDSANWFCPWWTTAVIDFDDGKCFLESPGTDL